MPKFIYVHGWGSSGDGETATLFKKLIPGLIAPTLDYYKPAEALTKLLEIVDEDPSEDVYLIASSLGGFFAENVAQRRVVHLISYNPSLRPYAVSSIDPEVMGNMTAFALHEGPVGPSTRSVVLCSDDDVVKPEYAAQYYKRYEVIWRTGGHRMTDHAAALILSLLNRKINSL